MLAISRLILAAIFLGSTCWTLGAQTDVTGTVVDHTGAPISFANVILITAADSAFVDGGVTNAAGAFTFDTDAAAGSYRLRVSSIGYGDVFAEAFTLSIAQPYAAGTITLGGTTLELETATVVATKPLFTRQIDRTIVNVADQPTAVGQTALELLERSPGVVVDRIGGNVSMLGKDGARVMINGRLNYMPADALLAYLAGIPASDIIRLELITTPPAELDAEGNAGYIDIVLRRLPDEGLRGTYALTGGSAFAESGAPGGVLREVILGNVSGTYRRGVTSLFGGLSYNRTDVPEESYLRRTVVRTGVEGPDSSPVEGEDRTDLVFARYPTSNFANARLGADFALSERTTLGLLASGYVNRFDMEATQRNVFGFGASPDSLLVTEVEEDNDWLHLQTGVSVSHTLQRGGSLGGGVDYLYYDNANPTTYGLTFQPVGGGVAFRQNRLASSKDSPFGILVAKLDYARPLGTAGGELNLGAKYVRSDFQNDVSLTRDERRDPAFSTESTLDESIAAAYAQVKGSANDFEYQVGLRYELTDTQLDEVTAGRLVDREYGLLFPNLSVGYRATNKLMITAGYSRRIDRPAFTQLAPFVFFLDPRTSFGGNPALQPGISNNIELGATRGDVSLQLGYSVIDSAIATFQPVFDTQLGTQLIRPLNLREQRVYSATLGVPTRLAPWWSGRLNAAYTYQETTSLVDGRDVVREQGTFRITGGQNFSFGEAWTLALSGFFQGRNLNGYVTTLPLVALNVALQRKLSAGTLTLAVDDALDTFESRNETSLPAQRFVSALGFDFSRPTVKVTWSAAFGNRRVKDASRDSAAEERERVN